MFEQDEDDMMLDDKDAMMDDGTAAHEFSLKQPRSPQVWCHHQQSRWRMTPPPHSLAIDSLANTRVS
jgi:hypothetical protein